MTNQILKMLETTPFGINGVTLSDKHSPDVLKELADKLTDRGLVQISMHEKDLLVRVLDCFGDRIADREGYSSGEPYWNLKDKLMGENKTMTNQILKMLETTPFGINGVTLSDKHSPDVLKELADKLTDRGLVQISMHEKDLLVRALDCFGDRIADREGYSSGEPYWNLKEKIINCNEIENPQKRSSLEEKIKCAAAKANNSEKLTGENHPNFEPQSNLLF